MGRIRTVKPELFMDEELGRLSGDHTRLFIGLLTMADKRGLLDDRPGRIRATLFAYRDVDMDGLLEDLQAVGKVVRYVDAEDRDCICIPGFQKHQRPHPKESENGLTPPTPEQVAAVTYRPSREKKRLAVEGQTTIPSSPARKGREGVLGREGVSGKEEVECLVAAEPPPPPPPGNWVRPMPADKLEAPTSPPETWTSPDFWVWTQAMREGVGLVAEKPPPQHLLDAWWAEVRGAGVSTARLKLAFRAFGEDAKWEAASPPLPFRAFIAQWRNFCPQEPPHAAAS